MVWQDTHLKEVFKEPPLIAYKRNQNLKEVLSYKIETYFYRKVENKLWKV